MIDRQHGPGHNFFCQFSFPHQKNPRHLHTSHNALYEPCPSATNFVTILQFVQHIYYSNILYICHFCQTSKLFYYTLPSKYCRHTRHAPLKYTVTIHQEVENNKVVNYSLSIAVFPFIFGNFCTINLLSELLLLLFSQIFWGEQSKLVIIMVIQIWHL